MRVRVDQTVNQRHGSQFDGIRRSSRFNTNKLPVAKANGDVELRGLGDKPFDVIRLSVTHDNSIPSFAGWKDRR